MYSNHLTNLRRTIQNEKDASLTALTQGYSTIRYSPDTLNFSIPVELWKHLDDTMQKRINRIRKDIRAEKKSSAAGRTLIRSENLILKPYIFS